VKATGGRTFKLVGPLIHRIAMNLDDESLLSAYLDGELDPGQRFRVESALLSDSALADQFRELTAVRDLVAGLPRAALAADVSASVVDELTRRGAPRPFRLLFDAAEGSWTARATAILSVAAALVAAATLGVIWSTSAARNRAPVRTLVLKSPVASPAPRSVDSVAPAPPNASAGRSTGTPREPEIDPRLIVLEPADQQYERAHESIRKLLDSPHLNRVFLVTDVVGGDAATQVGAILDKTPRHQSSYGRITVSQEIVIDPENPGRATVFAVVMDDREQHQLQQKLRASFRDALKEITPRPEVVTQLVDIGQVAFLPGTPVAELRIAGDLKRDALRGGSPRFPIEAKEQIHDFTADVDPLHNPENRIGVLVPSPRDGPTPEQERSGPHPSLRQQPQEQGAPAPVVAEAKARAGTRPPAPDPITDGSTRSKASVVLVWVAQPRARERGVR
jgi:hypothetical protein